MTSCCHPAQLMKRGFMIASAGHTAEALQGVRVSPASRLRLSTSQYSLRPTYDVSRADLGLNSNVRMEIPAVT